jgi:hypothetical protein
MADTKKERRIIALRGQNAANNQEQSQKHSLSPFVAGLGRACSPNAPHPTSNFGRALSPKAPHVNDGGFGETALPKAFLSEEGGAKRRKEWGSLRQQYWRLSAAPNAEFAILSCHSL